MCYKGPPFSVRKVTFYNAKGNLLDDERLPLQSRYMSLRMRWMSVSFVKYL